MQIYLSLQYRFRRRHVIFQILCNFYSTDNLKGSPATASPVTEYGSVPFKFPDKSYNTGGSNSPLRSKLLISRAKLHHHPVPFEEANNHNPPNDCIHKKFWK